MPALPRGADGVTRFEECEAWGPRGAERRRVAVGTQMRVGGERVAFAITDLSPAGLRGHADAPLPLGATVAVDLPRRGWVEAQIRWTRGNACGARFTGEIGPEDCGPPTPGA